MGRLSLVLTVAAGFVLAAPGDAEPSLSARRAPSPTVFLAPGGSDANRCSRTAPCRSFNRAYRAARPGQVVQVAGGTYGPQTISVDASKTSRADVLFRPAVGARVRVGSLDVHGAHLELRGMRFSPDWRTWREARDVTFRNVKAARFTIMGSRSVRVIGGSYGPTNNAYSSIQSEGASDTKVATNILLDRVRIHDYSQTDGSSHVDCLHVFGANGLTIRRSRFSNCEFFAILFTKIPGSPVPTPTNVTIENNFLDCCGQGYFSIYLGDQHGERWANFLVRNNSTNKAIGIGPDSRTVAALRFFGNIGPSFQGCGRAGVRVNYNVWYQGSRCGGHDRRAPSGFVDPQALNFHLRAGAAAIGRGNPASSPARDIDGQRRPFGRAPDAGADEWRR